MSIVNKPYTFTAGATIVASEHNSNFDTLYNDYNGNIDNSNLSAAAAIADSKLAQITTYGKVKGTAITDLASIASAAGSIPIANGGLGADLSTAGVGSIPYFAHVGTMTTLAIGNSGTFLMSTNTTASPVFSKVSVNSLTIPFGTWSTLLSTNTVYQAATDILIVASGVNGGGATGEVITILSDSANPPTTKKGTCGSGGAGFYGFVLVPVKKDDYWKETGSNTARIIYTIPIGS